MFSLSVSVFISACPCNFDTSIDLWLERFCFTKDKIIFVLRGVEALRIGKVLVFKAISQNMKGISAFRFFGYKSLPAVPLNSS